ncbi:MAG: hypothetical protein ACI9Y1_002896 [Lentisphaeria bacterium]|jgi:hypothetical protein
MKEQVMQILPVLALIVAGLAVFFGPLISYRATKKQIEASLRVSNKQVVAPIRQKWINELRILMADIIGKCTYYRAAGSEDRSDIEYQHITESIVKLRLYINPNEDDHVELLKQVVKMEHALFHGNSAENNRIFWDAHDGAVSKAQHILKREWERVKNEI